MGELAFNGSNDAVQQAKVSIVEAQPTGQFPDPFDGIQIRTVRRQEVQGKPRSLLVAPPQMKLGAMVLCVVADCQNAAAGNGTGFPKDFTLRNSQKVSPLHLPVSRRNRNAPSRKRTAAKSRSMPTAFCHPRDGPASPRRSVFAATPDGFLSPVLGSVGAGVRIALPRSDRPVPADRSGETNTPPHAVRRPAVEPPPGTSCPARPAGRRAAGDRSATPKTAESPVANPTRKWRRISGVVS